MALKLGLKWPPGDATLGTIVLLASMAAVAMACKTPGEDTRECNVNADCASGQCNPDGTCEPFVGQGGEAAGGAATGGSAAGGSAAGGDGGGGGAGGCQPNYDGTITAEEMPLGPGFAAMFRVSEQVDPFSSAPDCSSGECLWDFVNVGGVTEEVQSLTEEIDGKWYADNPAFADATYAARMADFKLGLGGITICEQVQYGVFEVTPFGLLLLGLVSEHEADGTELVYDPPVPILQFPMTVGTSWKIDTTATGPLCNSVFDYAIEQTYDAAVDQTGEVRTPYGDFTDVLRVNTLVERHMGVGVMPSQARTHTYVAECFTTVAAVVSVEGETEPDFNEAAEVRRLSMLP